MTKSKIFSAMFACLFLFLTLSLLTHPQEAFTASLRGLNLWWTVIFPALLPFFVLSELLVAFGIVHFIGTLLEPIMRPIFRLPGIAGYVLVMSMASGSPSGAKITTELRNEKQLTKIEAQRLIMFTNTANPLFIFGAIAIGFFNNPKIGVFLAITHYLSSICLGILGRFYGRRDEPRRQREKKGNIIKKAFITLHHKRLSEKRPLGKILGEAVTNSVHLLLMIGGFIILFAVLNTLLNNVHVFPFIVQLLTPIFQFFHIQTTTITSILSGFLEMTIGIEDISKGSSSMTLKLIICSFLLGFSGLSIHAQVATLLSYSDIRYFPYFIARIGHGILASIFTFFLLKFEPFSAIVSGSLETVASSYPEILTTKLQLVYKVTPLFTLLILYMYLFYQLTYVKKIKN